MKAMVWTRYGPPEVLQLQEIPKPVPKDGEVLIRVHAATVTAGDCEARSLHFSRILALMMRAYVGLRKPARKTILGQEFAGEVEAVGRAVTRFREGDKVFGHSGFMTGTYAEYICMPEEPTGINGLIEAMPVTASFEEAAAVPVGGLEALYYLRRADLQSGQRVLIIGAGGSIGTFGVQLGKHFGADVTAVDSAAKLEMLRAIGADHVIDYTREDFTSNGQTYDVILDVVGKIQIMQGMGSLTDAGVYLLANMRTSKVMRGQWASRRTNKTLISGATYQAGDLAYLKELIEAGKLKTIIDRHYPLEQTAEAHRYVETGQKAGNVIITVREKDE